MVITQPQGLEKADFLGTAGRNRWVTVFLSPDYVVNKLGVDPDGFPEQLANFLKTGVSELYCQSLPLSWEMKAIIADLMEDRYQGPIRQVHSEAKALELICIMLQNISREFFEGGTSSSVSHISVRLEQARDILTESYCNPPTLADLGRQVGLNRSRLAQDFKTRFGMTICDYAAEMRMQQASEMLQNSQFSIGHIAETLGYTYSRNFSQAFRRHFGVSPRAARKLY
jgi:AraC-like DNA-binding protein